MKRFKLIKKYPNLDTRVKEGDIISEVPDNNDVFIHEIGKFVIVVYQIDEFPEYWKEIKEPLFTTFDGVDIYSKTDNIYVYNKQTFSEEYVTLLHCVDKSKWMKLQNSDIYICFSSRETGRKWVEENKPKFSIKQIEDAIENNSTYIQGLGFNIIYHDSFKKALGI